MKTIKNLTAEEIRKSILQLAIQGKLVKQDPNDEPASDLVKRIYTEKQKLIKEGKIKKDKNESYIYKGDDNCYYEKVGKEIKNITEELPFKIPDSWIWIRLSSAYLPIGTGVQHYDGIKDYYSTGSLNNGTFVPEGKYAYDKRPSRANRICYKNDLIDAKMQSTNKCAIIDDNLNGMLFSTGFYCFRAMINNIEYLKNFINSDYFQKTKDSLCSGVTQKAINDDKLFNILLPLPPLNEQRRINEKIITFESLIQKYEQQEQLLSKLESSFEDKLKASILQYAIEGKLVKQNPNDEPASQLLERVKEEKEKLIREGKIKRNKSDSELIRGVDKNYYENIPNGWINSKLSFVINLVSGVDLSPSEYSSENIGVPYITGASNFHEGRIFFSRYTKEKYINSQKGDILLTCKGTIGELAFNNIGDCHVARQIMSIKSFINPEFLAYWLLAKRKQLISSGKSIIPGIDRKTILESYILIPPLLEEKRISEKLDASFTLIQSS